MAVAAIGVTMLVYYYNMKKVWDQLTLGGTLILCDGEKIADFNAYHNAGKGRLFFWRDVLLKDYAKGESSTHRWTIDPVPDGKGEFRIGAICTATIKPEAEFAGDAGSDFDISAIDHARGVK